VIVPGATFDLVTKIRSRDMASRDRETLGFTNVNAVAESGLTLLESEA
jgi:hypothetical protein